MSSFNKKRWLGLDPVVAGQGKTIERNLARYSKCKAKFIEKKLAK